MAFSGPNSSKCPICHCFVPIIYLQLVAHALKYVYHKIS